MVVELQEEESPIVKKSPRDKKERIRDKKKRCRRDVQSEAQVQCVLFSAHSKIASVEKKAAWAQRCIGSDAAFAKRLVAFAAVEGIFFSGVLCHFLAQKAWSHAWTHLFQ